ncbi:tyrosine-type recombinase/integrase [Phocaeicola vulgatus]|nr:tyrosine-type recombinase/integrase [Phocaeicola vulgatus]MCR1855663.1 tyrosine-type recombinase/integrase [Phocaeicola vulgatus]
MQNAVYERKQNGEGFFSLPAVTYSRFGNCPANGLVTEQPQYSVIICIFSTWQNAETKLISNGLRFIFTCPLFLVQPITFHVARHSFITNIMANGANIKTAASLAGHSTTRHTEKYVHIIDELKQKAVDSLPDIIVNYK